MKHSSTILNNKNKVFFSIFISSSLFFPMTVLKAQAQAQHNHNHEQNNYQEKSENVHHHQTLDISNKPYIPTIKINVVPDKMKGWNLEIKTTNFTFNPETLNEDSNPNKGHAHLYINEEKVTRIYSNWYHISELPKGENKIKVTLNTNLHEDLIYHGNVIGDQVIIMNN
ncbi:hypothetical protein GM3708_3206 [Geminocystis sp. NIES-3708]|uniref:hypothetical protein n=1 Tax=Geminocystis sp. NIES-3708 TaxID=1615909 RepID=UPI0005FC48FD|nr:hypothetical protein [Geminocystis sp. NIES-3708]BAQ62800.1 hypothetical protein GM3708_3206 [Geminocystis sp. NIES-3708]